MNNFTQIKTEKTYYMPFSPNLVEIRFAQATSSVAQLNT